LHNAIKHSGAKNVYVKLKFDPAFELSIKDDGKGFKPQQVFEGGDGSGLRNIVRRATMAGFHCDIDAAPGEGCSYYIRSKSAADENTRAN
jgi:two-component system NarL family sensor kinase